MTICFITDEYITEARNFDGGLSNYLLRVCLGLNKLGHRPIVIVTSNKTELIEHNDIEVHRVKVDYQFKDGPLNWLYQSYFLHQYLTNLLITYTIDIIQYATCAGIGYYRIKKIPSVVRISSYEPMMPMYSGYNIDDFKYEIQLAIASIKKADAIFGPCRIVAQEIQKKENLSTQIIESPYVYDVEKLDYKVYNQIGFNKKYFLFFGTVCLLKGVKTIADILPDIFSKHSDIYFIFIGKDIGYEGKKMMDYVLEKAGNNKDMVLYHDKLSHELLYPFIENALAIILPSRTDNFPNTCIEAMAHGKIVLGTRDTGFEQLIADEVNGFLCEKDNPGSLFFAIEKILALNNDKKSVIQSNAIKRIDLLKPEFVVRELVDFYNSTIVSFKEKFHEIDEIDEIGTSMLWGKLKFFSDDNAKLLNQISQRDFRDNSFYNSKTYRIIKTAGNPVRYFANLLKRILKH